MALIRGMKVPIPADGRKINEKVFKVTPAQPGERWPQKTLIGKIPVKDSNYREEDYITEDGIQLMIPNSNYRREYKVEFNKYKEIYGIRDVLPPDAINVGLYLLVLGVACKLGIYQLLCKIFPIILANGIMDAAMFYISERRNDINVMEEKMKQELMFSIRAQDDDWYSKVFQNYSIIDNPTAVFSEAIVNEFMRKWVQMRIEAGLENAYLSLDGTNFDCQSVFNDEAQQGHAKSGKKINIVGVMAAVEASGNNRGMPLAYTIDPGSKNDATTAQDLLFFFTGMGLKIKCLLADRGFPYEDVLKICDELGMPFLMMIKVNYEAFKTMFTEFKDTIFWNEEYWIEGTTNIYGISKDGVHLYSKNSENPDRVVCVAIFFDGSKAGIHKAEAKKKLNLELERLREKLKVFNDSGIIQKVSICYEEKGNGDSTQPKNSKIVDLEKLFAALAERDIGVSKEYKDIIELKYDEKTGGVTATVRRDALAEKYKMLGFSCMVSSEPKTAQEMSDEYMLRDYSEKAFCAMKTELGFRTIHTKGAPSFHGKFFTCYVADIIRNEIVCVFHRYEISHHHSIDTNAMIAAFSNISYARNNEGYRYSGQASTAQEEILASLGIAPEAIKMLGPLVRERIGEEDLDILRSTKRELPVVPKKRGAGRPKGSKNKPKDDASKKDKPTKKEDKKGNQSDGHPDNASIADNTETNNSIDNTNLTSSTDAADMDDQQYKNTSEPDSTSSETQVLGLPESADAGSIALIHDGEQQVAIEQEEEENSEKSPDIVEDLPTEGLELAKAEEGLGTDNMTVISESEDLPSNGASDSKPSVVSKTSRIGTQYKKTALQDAKDRELSEKTGIDIIGNPPPRPWSRAFRAAETRRRNRLRKEAEKKWREISAATSPEPDQ